MAKLRIEIGGSGSDDDAAAPARLGAIVARATQLLGGDNLPPQNPDRREMLISIGGDAQSIDIEPGLWNVELALPSGELVAQQARVAGEEEAPLRFELGAAPQPWLAWQFAEGSVPENGRYQNIIGRGATTFYPSPRGVKPLAVPDVPRRASQIFRKSLGTPMLETSRYAGIGLARDRIRFRSQVTLLRHARQATVSTDGQFAQALGEWRALVDSARLEDSIIDLPGMDIDPNYRLEKGGEDAWHQLWQLTDNPHDKARRYVVVVTKQGIDFASLPLPWGHRDDQAGGSLVEISVDKSDVARPSQTSVTMRDEKFLGLLSYLKTSSFALAASAVSNAEGGANQLLEDVLREKRANPLAAAAAAYALLGATDLREDRQWFSWIDNLANWFPKVPDGAILQGRLLIGRGGDPDTAKKAYLEAFGRGLPYYAIGLDWLLDGLRQFEDDARCNEAARVVRQCSIRSDVSQVFTVLRFRPPAMSSEES